MSGQAARARQQPPPSSQQEQRERRRRIVEQAAKKWKSLVLERRLIALGSRSFRSRHLRPAFQQWKDFLVARKRHWAHTVALSATYEYVVRKRFWNRWQQRLIEAVRFENAHFAIDCLFELSSSFEDMTARAERVAEAKVRAFRTRRLCGPIVRAWRLMASTVQVQLEQAQHLYDWHLQRLSHSLFAQWANLARQALSDRALDKRGMAAWRLRTLRRALHRWRGMVLQHQRQHDLMERIQSLGLRAQRRRYFRNWMKWVVDLKQAQYRLGRAIQLRDETLQRTCLLGWRRYVHDVRTRIRPAARQRILDLRLKLMRLAFRRWRIVTHHIAALIAQEAEEARQAQRALTRRAFDRWREAALQHRADNFHAKYVRQRVWASIWQDMRLAARAHTFRRRHALRAAVESWHEVVEERDVARRKAKRARQHFQRRLLSRMVHEWRQNAHEQKIEGEYEDLADELRRRAIMRRVFDGMRAAVASHRTEEQMMALAARWHLWKATQRWKSFAFARVVDTTNRRIAARYRYARLLRTCFARWCEWMSKELGVEASLHPRLAVAQRRTMQRFWSIWRSALVQTRSERQREATGALHWKHSRLAAALEQWRSATDVLREERILAKAAQAHYASTTKRKVVRLWDAMVFRRMQKRVELDKLVKRANIKLAAKSRAKVFRHWLAVARQVAQEKASIRKADRFRLKQCVARWRAFVALRRAVHQRYALAKATNSRYALRHAWRCWQHAFRAARVVRHKNVAALRHWSTRLSRTIWAAWMRYVDYRRQKRSALRRATALRTIKLQREAAAQWMAAATTMRSLRVEAAKDRQAWHMRHVLDLVERIAAHWRRKTLARRQRLSGLGSAGGAVQPLFPVVPPWQRLHAYSRPDFDARFVRPSGVSAPTTTFRDRSAPALQESKTHAHTGPLPSSIPLLQQMESLSAQRNRPPPRRPVELNVPTQLVSRVPMAPPAMHVQPFPTTGFLPEVMQAQVVPPAQPQHAEPELRPAMAAEDETQQLEQQLAALQNHRTRHRALIERQAALAGATAAGAQASPAALAQLAEVEAELAWYNEQKPAMDAQLRAIATRIAQLMSASSMDVQAAGKAAAPVAQELAPSLPTSQSLRPAHFAAATRVS